MIAGFNQGVFLAGGDGGIFIVGEALAAGDGLAAGEGEAFADGEGEGLGEAAPGC